MKKIACPMRIDVQVVHCDPTSAAHLMWACGLHDSKIEEYYKEMVLFVLFYIIIRILKRENKFRLFGANESFCAYLDASMINMNRHTNIKHINTIEKYTSVKEKS